MQINCSQWNVISVRYSFATVCYKLYWIVLFQSTARSFHTSAISAGTVIYVFIVDLKMLFKTIHQTTCLYKVLGYVGCKEKVCTWWRCSYRKSVACVCFHTYGLNPAAWVFFGICGVMPKVGSCPWHGTSLSAAVSMTVPCTQYSHECSHS